MTETEEALVMQTPYLPAQARAALQALGRPTPAALRRLIELACTGHPPDQAAQLARSAARG